MLEYLSALDEETTEVCSLDSPHPLALPLVEEEEAVSEPEPEGLLEACDDLELAADNLGEGTICIESSQQEPITKPGFTHLSSSPCYYFYQGEGPQGGRWGFLPQICLRGVAWLSEQKVFT